MLITTARRSFFAAALLLPTAWPLAALADSKVPPLTIVVPSAAGSAPDIVARLLGDELRTQLGQPVLIDNKPGAGGIVAVLATRSAGAPAHTLLLAQAAVATVTPLTYRAAKYDMARDFEAIAVVTKTPMLFVSSAAGDIKILADALAQGRVRPDSLAISSPPRGSIPHLSGELLQQASGARFNAIPMGGSGQSIQAVIGGDSQIAVDGIAPLLPLVKAGRLRALAVTSSQALPGLESLPLAKDTVPGLDVSGWFMLFGNKGMPAERVQAINAAVASALKSPELVRKLQATANYPVGGSVADAGAFLEREKRRWADAVQRAGLQPE